MCNLLETKAGEHLYNLRNKMFYISTRNNWEKTGHLKTKKYV